MKSLDTSPFFAIGHSITLLYGVLSGAHFNLHRRRSHRLSVVYKALDNLGAFRRWFGYQPDTRGAVLIFGLSTDSGWQPNSRTSLYPKMACREHPAFNVGVEIGQILALSAILILMGFGVARAHLPGRRLPRMPRSCARASC